MVQLFRKKLSDSEKISDKNSGVTESDLSRGGVTGAPEGGRGNTPLKHEGLSVDDKVDVAKRILSKRFVDVSFQAENSCPINGISIGLDYLQCTGNIPLDDHPDRKIGNVIRFVKSFLDVGLTDSGDTFSVPRRTYNNKYTSINGVVFAYGYFDDGLHYYLQFPGVPLRMLRALEWKALISGLYFDHYAKFTRSDLRFDDYKRRITGQKLVELAQRGDVGRVQKYKYIESGAIGSPGETTVYFGGGRKQLYFYNAEFIHGIPADRWEARFREGGAHQILTHIAELEYTLEEHEREELTQDQIVERMLRYMGSVCLGCVDFVHRNNRKGRSLKEFDRYDFWQSLIDDIGGIEHISVPRPKLDAIQFVQKTVKWLDKSVFKRFAICFTAFGKEFFDEYFNQEIKLGSARFDDNDLDWISQLKNLFDTLESDAKMSKLEFINYLKST